MIEQVFQIISCILIQLIESTASNSFTISQKTQVQTE